MNAKPNILKHQILFLKSIVSCLNHLILTPSIVIIKINTQAVRKSPLFLPYIK